MIKPEDDKDGLCWRAIVSKTLFYYDWHEEFLLECRHIDRRSPHHKTPFITKLVCYKCQEEFEFNKKQIPLITADNSNLESDSGESEKSSKA